MHDSSTTTLLILLAVVAVLLTVLFIAVRACARDARRRGKSPLLVCIAAILFFPWGLIAWLIFRPTPVDGPQGREPFELNDHRVQ